jgi:hypothetical protein
VVMPASGTIGERQHHDLADLGCRQPLQAVFTEFVCLDNESNLPSLDDISGQRNLLKLNSQIEVIWSLFPPSRKLIP